MGDNIDTGTNTYETAAWPVGTEPDPATYHGKDLSTGAAVAVPVAAAGAVTPAAASAVAGC